MRLDILRLGMDPYMATVGILCLDLEMFCFTLEPPWKDNANGQSCIPEGTYDCNIATNRKLHSGQIVDETLEVQVPGRSGILFHIGNYARDTTGCILLGYSADVQIRAISASTPAFRHFVEKLKGDSFTLCVKDAMKPEVIHESGKNAPQ